MYQNWSSNNNNNSNYNSRRYSSVDIDDEGVTYWPAIHCCCLCMHGQELPLGGSPCSLVMTPAKCFEEGMKSALLQVVSRWMLACGASNITTKWPGEAVWS